MLFHGVAKIQHGVGWIAGALQDHGLPASSPTACMWGDPGADTDHFGAVHPPAALVYAFTLVVAFLMVGTGKVFSVTDVGAWGIENELVFFMGGLAILLLGSGKYAIARNEAIGKPCNP
ncbi:Uncharacterised protein [Serratia marcescens]|nr:Uncharacterised protein [Serratia marcescens]